MGSLAGKTLFITGASRGIGEAIALRAAQDGANVVIAAKTAEPHAKLEGTIYTAAEKVEKAGGKALPLMVDIRFEDQIASAMQKAAETFGGIDILVNNASAINLSDTATVDMKRFDLMHSINLRGTFLCGKLALPYLKKSSNAHILNLSPPLNMEERWFAPHVAYTMAKFGMSMCVLGWAGELRGAGIAANALWPRTTIATAAISCTFTFDKTPPDASQIYVFFDGQAVPNDLTMMNGWVYDPATNSVTFYGMACDDLKAGMVTDVEVIFGCDVQ